MKQNSLIDNIKCVYDYNDTARVVAIDRKGEEEITLRFVMNDVAWDVHSREVVINKELAEQLLHMLADELEESSEPFHYSYKFA